MARYVHARSNRARAPFISVNCAAIPEKPARIRAVRPREGRLHRRGRPPHRQVRGGRRRHAAARRNLRDGRAPAGQAAARHPGARDRPRRRRQAGAGRHPHHRHLQPQPRRGGARGHVPRGPAVPPQRREPARSRRCASVRPTCSSSPSTSSRNIPHANGVPPRPLSAEARRALVLNRWPGNVRELENTLHRAVLLATGDEIGIDGILTPDGVRLDQAQESGGGRRTPRMAAETVTRALVGRTVADVERDLILETLKHCLGNRTHAANILGISIRTLRNKLNEYAGRWRADPAARQRRGAAGGVDRRSGRALRETRTSRRTPERVGSRKKVSVLHGRAARWVHLMQRPATDREPAPCRRKERQCRDRTNPRAFAALPRYARPTDPH